MYIWRIGYKRVIVLSSTTHWAGQYVESALRLLYPGFDDLRRMDDKDECISLAEPGDVVVIDCINSSWGHGRPYRPIIWSPLFKEGVHVVCVTKTPKEGKMVHIHFDYEGVLKEETPISLRLIKRKGLVHLDLTSYLVDHSPSIRILEFENSAPYVAQKLELMPVPSG